MTALLVSMAVLGAGWFFLAPPALGGGTSYVITDGISMLPRFHTGDLALMRAAGDYRVGDIVAYRSHELHKIVLHRIVATSGGRYIFKGDNNSWRDPEHVTRSQVIGTLWVAVPGLGGKLRSLGSPATMAIMAGLATLLLFSGAGARAHVRRRHGRRVEPKWNRDASPKTHVGGSSAGLVVALVALTAFLGVAAFSWTAPAGRLVTASTGYQQSGSFSYAARVARGAVYDTGLATTGQPIFSRLINRVQVGFRYALRSPSAGHLDGIASLNAVVASQSGWTHTIELEPPTPFTGRHVAVAGTLRLWRLQGLLRRVAALTGVPDASFTVTLVPAVHTRGTLAGRRFHTGYAPTLALTLTPLELQPAGAAASFHRVQGGSVEFTRSATAILGPARLHVPVAAARIVAPLGVAVSLLAVIVAALQFARARRADEPTRIQAKYGDSIITVAHSTLGRRADLVQVRSMEALALLAERYDSLIMHEQTDLGHAYLLNDNGTLYAYLVHVRDSETELRERLISDGTLAPPTAPATPRYTVYATPPPPDDAEGPVRRAA